MLFKLKTKNKALIISLIPKLILSLAILSMYVYSASFNDQKDIYDLFKREIKNLKNEKFENITQVIKNIKINQGDLIMENLKIGSNPENIKDYLFKKYGFEHNINDKLKSINITNLIIISKADFIKSIDSVKYSNAITILRKNIRDPSTFDLFSLFTISSGNVEQKVYESKECYNILGFAVCNDSKEFISGSTNVQTNYLMENILNAISILKMKNIMDSYSLSIFLKSDEKFDLPYLYKNLDLFCKPNFRLQLDLENNKQSLSSELKFLDETAITEKSNNYSIQNEEESYLTSLINTIKKYRLYYSEKKIEIENLQNKYNHILAKESYTLNKNSRMQMITGINKADIDSYLGKLKKKYEVPFNKQDEFDAALESTVLASQNVWTYIDFLYSKNNDGKIKFLAIFSMEDKNQLYNLLIFELVYDFVLGKNILFITKTNSSSFGFFNTQDEIIEEIPVENNSEHVKDIQKVLSENAIKSFASYLKIED